jgi:hypothetical protein
LAGAEVAGAAAGAGGAAAGFFSAMRIETSAGGACGGAGIVPVTLFWLATRVSGTSTIFVALTFIPFFKPNASTICPSTSNFYPFGILNWWFWPLSRVRITEFGGFTYHTYSRNRLNSRNQLWSGCGCDRPLQFHAGLQVMNAKLPAVLR